MKARKCLLCAYTKRVSARYFKLLTNFNFALAWLVQQLAATTFGYVERHQRHLCNLLPWQYAATRTFDCGLANNYVTTYTYDCMYVCMYVGT